jgi:hypothetical protein
MKNNICNSANSLIKKQVQQKKYIILSMLKFPQNILFSRKCFCEGK